MRRLDRRLRAKRVLFDSTLEQIPRGRNIRATPFAQKTVVAPDSYARITGLAANTEYQIKINATTYDATTEFSPVITRTTASTPFVKTALAAPTVSARGISSHALVANCIVIQNSASSNPNFGFNSSMTSAPNIDGRKSMTGANVVWKSGNNYVYDSSKALFVNANSDWHLTGTGSQACNVGNNDYAAGSTDLDGNTRKRGGTVDLGCYEVQAGSSSALLDDEAELFDEMDDSLDLIAASLLGLE